MSASLVGSEMCIRDRCCARNGAGRRQRRAPTAAALPRLLGAAPGVTASAVSYTHLTLPTICSV
eukprot:14787693-Alexandrium_andersonii.AAC.1